MTYVFIENKVIYQIDSDSKNAERIAISWAEHQGYTVINVDDNPFGGRLIYVSDSMNELNAKYTVRDALKEEYGFAPEDVHDIHIEKASVRYIYCEIGGKHYLIFEGDNFEYMVTQL